jgi:hypothetical protein
VGRCRSISRLSNAILNTLDQFFFDDAAFTFKGAMGFVLQVLGLLGLLVSIQFLARPVSVVVENREPVGYFDAALYEESFKIRGVEYPDKLRESIARLVQRDWAPRTYLIQVGPVARGLPKNPGEVRHHIVCWYAEPRSTERQREVLALRDAALNKAKEGCCGQPFDMASRIERARLQARAAEQTIDLRRAREFSASQALIELNSFSSEKTPLDLATVMKPADAGSLYSRREAWKEDIGVAEIPSMDEIIRAVEGSDLQGLLLAISLEQIDHVRRFINWVEVSNRSSHGLAARATVSINQAGGSIELLASPLEWVQRGRRFTASVEKLLPGETLWAVFRSRRPIRQDEIEVIADPTPFFDPSYIRRVTPILGVVVLIWVIANGYGRYRRRRGTPFA